MIDSIVRIPIQTIGYGQRPIADFILLLEQYQIAYLLDIRSKPYSKFNPSYTRITLEAFLTTAGIKYVYMGETLGGQPDFPSCYTKDGKVDYEQVKKKDFYLRGIKRLRDAWEQGLRIVLMCSEAKPELCHRSKLIGETLVEVGIPISHIDENGLPLSQQDVLLRLSGGQLGFSNFLNPGFTSRKSYRDQDDMDDLPDN